MKRQLAIASIVTLLTSLAGCSSQESAELAQIKKDQAALKADQDALKAENEQLKAKLAEATKSAPPPVAQTAPPTTTPTDSTPSTDAAAGFTDIGGVFGEKEIEDMAKWHIFDPLSDKFEPHKPITRAEFVRWLVRAQNSYHSVDRPDNKIRMPEDNVSSFPDVSPSNPDFKYIQALVNAGFVVGYDDKYFRPDAILTREQMIGIKVPVDYGKELDKNCKLSDLKNTWGTSLPQFADLDKISPRYWAAFNYDGSINSHTASNNVKRVCGTTKFFKPQAPVTRGEAAVCLWEIGEDGTHNATAGKR